MSAAFTLNFFRSGINFNKWGSFQLPGLLNFGEFKVTPSQSWQSSKGGGSMNAGTRDQTLEGHVTLNMILRVPGGFLPRDQAQTSCGGNLSAPSPPERKLCHFMAVFFFFMSL